MKFLFSVNARIAMLVALLLIGIPVSLYLVNQQQNLQQHAWQTDQSATAMCDSNSGKVIIDARFTNTEPNNPQYAMKVVAKDNQTGNQVDLGTVNPGQTQRGNIQTGRDQIGSGTVTFVLTWASGQPGGDTRSAGYSAAGPCPQPTSVPTPTVQPSNTPVPPTSTPVPPTATPVPPTATPVPPTATPVPTNTPVPTITPTPTEIPPTIVIPTPTGSISSCPVPKQVQNIKVECPYCR